mmetsp:Transcript_30290/g.87328  ORF Transcript_30290/g.87328 Transcript_30290/m.87328 type:complete len:256 (-) Transcript_30290:2606-3373(-)
MHAGAPDAVEGPAGAEAALLVHTVGHAPEHPRVASRLPIVGDDGFVRERAPPLLCGRALDVAEGTLPAESATDVLPIREAALHAHVARGVPEVRHLGLVVEVARRRGGRGGDIRAIDAGERVLAAEPALRVDGVGPAAELAHLAGAVPIVRRGWLRCEVAAFGRARNVDVVPLAAKAAGQVDAISKAPQHPGRASRLPIVPRKRLQRELARVDRGWPRAGRGVGRHGHGSHGDRGGDRTPGGSQGQADRCRHAGC